MATEPSGQAAPARRHWRVAVFTGSFPVVSETFVTAIVRGLLDGGNEVEIFADTPGVVTASPPLATQASGFEPRLTYMNLPEEMAPWELPVWPWYGRTWKPGADKPLWNALRLVRALSRVMRCGVRAPRLTRRVLSRKEYGYQASSLSALYRLDRLLRTRRRFDVLHAHFGPVGNSFRFARQLLHAPMVVTFHGYDFCAVPRQQGAGVYAKLFATADAITVNSGYTRQQVIKLGADPDRVHGVPMGVDLRRWPFRERTRARDEPLRVLTVARLVPIKGHAWALEALAELMQRGISFEYEVVGEGPERKALEAQAERLGMSSSVRFRGSCDPEGVARWMAWTHVFLLPSVTVKGDQEGQGLVLQEAQACGIPVVATAHGGLPEGLDPAVSGEVVPEGDVKALADCLQAFHACPERWPAMGRAGRRLVEQRYDLATLVPRWLDVYARAEQHYSQTQHA